jgi:hypothetical protein
MIHKYKAWDKKNGRWIYGEPGSIESYMGDDYYSLALFEFANIEDIEIVMYLDLTDIHGQKLYYKDFVEARDIRHKSAKLIRGWIDYANGSFCINDGICTHYRWIDYGVEKIGNILEDPELLEDL